MRAGRGEVRLVQSHCNDAAGAAGGFRGDLGRLRGAGDGMTQVGGQKYTVLACLYMLSASPTFRLARTCHTKPPPPRKGPKHAQIRLLRQQHRSSDFAQTMRLSCTRTNTTA